MINAITNFINNCFESKTNSAANEFSEYEVDEEIYFNIYQGWVI